MTRCNAGPRPPGNVGGREVDSAQASLIPVGRRKLRVRACPHLHSVAMARMDHLLLKACSHRENRVISHRTDVGRCNKCPPG
jgi:hypothetical protein